MDARKRDRVAGSEKENVKNARRRMSGQDGQDGADGAMGSAEGEGGGRCGEEKFGLPAVFLWTEECVDALLQSDSREHVDAQDSVRRGVIPRARACFSVCLSDCEV